MPDKEREALSEWTEAYIRNKDLLLRQITNILRNHEGWDFVLNTATGERYCLVLPELSDLKQHLERIGDKTLLVVTLNRKTNIETLMAAWPNLVNKRNLTVIFSNPESNTETKWVIVPAVHDRVTERKSLRLGLMSLFSTVEEC